LECPFGPQKLMNFAGLKTSRVPLDSQVGRRLHHPQHRSYAPIDEANSVRLPGRFFLAARKPGSYHFVTGPKKYHKTP
jgi:hypothetical protein